METPMQWMTRKGRYTHNLGTKRFTPTLKDMQEYAEEMNSKKV